MDNAKMRVVLLASSGLILTAALLACVRDRAPKFFADNNPFAHKRQASHPSPTFADRASTPQMFPATKLIEASKQARLTGGRINPMAPIAAPGSTSHIAMAPTCEYQPAQSPSRVTKRNLQVPPPPAIPLAPRMLAERSDEIELPAPPSKPAEPKILTLDDVRLVGIVDGRAFLSVSKRVANQFNIPRNFTLGAGEQMESIAVDSVATTSAKLHDGQRVAIKELKSIR